MGNIRDLKKNINYILGDVIESVYIWEHANSDKSSKKGDAIIDEAIDAFDDLITRVNAKKVDNKKEHFKSITKDLEAKELELIEKINALD